MTRSMTLSTLVRDGSRPLRCETRLARNVELEVALRKMVKATSPFPNVKMIGVRMSFVRTEAGTLVPRFPLTALAEEAWEATKLTPDMVDTWFAGTARQPFLEAHHALSTARLRNALRNEAEAMLEALAPYFKELDTTGQAHDPIHALIVPGGAILYSELAGHLLGRYSEAFRDLMQSNGFFREMLFDCQSAHEEIACEMSLKTAVSQLKTLPLFQDLFA